MQAILKVLVFFCSLSVLIFSSACVTTKPRGISEMRHLVDSPELLKKNPFKTRDGLKPSAQARLDLRRDIDIPYFSDETLKNSKTMNFSSFPYTAPFLSLYVDEKIKQSTVENRWSEEQAKEERTKDWESRSKLVLVGKTCFNLDLSVAWDQKPVDQNLWDIDLVQDDGSVHRVVVLTQKQYHSKTHYVSTSTYGYSSYTSSWTVPYYSSTGIGCVNKTTDFSKPFALKLTPRISPYVKKGYEVFWLVWDQKGSDFQKRFIP